MENSKNKHIMDGSRIDLNRHQRIGHYFGNAPLWERLKPVAVRGSRSRFLTY